MQILLIEDSHTLAETIKDFLRLKKIEVTLKFDGLDGYLEALQGIYDVIILDIMLPSKDGYQILKDLRKNKINTPILMLSAKNRVVDKAQAFDFEADDYLTKPFDLEELLMRIKALNRRKNSKLVSSLNYNDLILDEDSHILFVNNQQINLSIKEFEILRLLILADGKLVNKDYITSKVWIDDDDNLYNSCEVYISFLRKKLKILNSTTEITSLRGLGYKLNEKA